MEKTKELGVVKGFEVSQNGPVITHLLFADNTLFFCDPNRLEILDFRVVLRCFELDSGRVRFRPPN